jgi:hypothetical protein
VPIGNFSHVTWQFVDASINWTLINRPGTGCQGGGRASRSDARKRTNHVPSRDDNEGRITHRLPHELLTVNGSGGEEVSIREVAAAAASGLLPANRN